MAIVVFESGTGYQLTIDIPLALTNGRVAF